MLPLPPWCLFSGCIYREQSGLLSQGKQALLLLLLSPERPLLVPGAFPSASPAPPKPSCLQRPRPVPCPAVPGQEPLSPVLCCSAPPCSSCTQPEQQVHPSLAGVTQKHCSSHSNPRVPLWCNPDLPQSEVRGIVPEQLRCLRLRIFAF